MLWTGTQEASSHLAEHAPGHYGHYTTDLPAPLGPLLKGSWTQDGTRCAVGTLASCSHLIFGVRTRSTACVWPCPSGQGGSGELACTVTRVVFPSMSVRRGDICVCRVVLGRIHTWALGSWGRRGAALPSAEADS